jgi:serine/threonine protein kinase
VPFSVGDLIDGHYRIEQRFAGGMGFVYIVLDEVVRKRFAIKQLSELHAENETLRERFRREASTWLLLDYHPHIVQAHSYLPRPEAPMLILEFVDGPSLDALLRAETRIGSGQVIAFARQICQAMQHAHSRVIADRGTGVLHRDIKPGNLLITRQCQLKVTDFGLAKTQGDTNLTSEGQFVGTVAYSSPEQLRAAGEVTKASDVYSFGAVMYQMLTGHQPFSAPNAAELYYLIQETEPRTIVDLHPDIHEGLAAVVLRCLRKDPATRFQDFTELDAALVDLGTVFPDPDERRCPNCGFASRSEMQKCTVCGTSEHGPEPAATLKPPKRTPNAWKCVCGASVAAGQKVCPKCNRPQSDRSKPPSAAARSWPTGAEDDAPLPVAGLSDSAPGATVELVTGWSLDADKQYLVELKAGGAILPWQLERAGYTVGCAENMKIRLADPSVARYQLFLVKLPCGWLAINPVPNSPMAVNGIEAKQRLLRPADLLRVGATWLAYSGPNERDESLAPIPGRWRELLPPKAQTIQSGGSNATKAEAPIATACTLEIAGGGKFTTRGQPIRIGSSPLCEVGLGDSGAAPVEALVAWQSDGPHLINVAGGLVRLVGSGDVTDRLLRNGDLLQIAATPIRVQIDGDPLAPGRRWSAAVTAPRRFALTVLTGNQKGQTAVLTANQTVTLGRHSDCGVVLASDSFVSRRHVQLVARDGAIDLKDLRSRSGFFVNQTHFNTAAVAHLGDVIVVGKTSMLVHYELETD